jgi:myo-inositol-1(or 4)-monophosphatase
MRGQGGPAERLEASQTARVTDAVVAVDWAHEEEERQRTLDAFGRVAPVCTSVRTLGSACLALAFTAAGWLDAYFHFSLRPWDAAGAAALLGETDCRLTTPEGAAWQVGQPGLVASNGRLHDELLGVMGSAP